MKRLIERMRRWRGATSSPLQAQPSRKRRGTPAASGDRPWPEVLEELSKRPDFRPGIADEAVAEFEARQGVLIPTDVLTYLRACDGTGQGGMDSDACMSFWPLADILPVSDVLGDCPSYDHPDCFVFADHLLHSWHYAVQLTPDPAQPAPVYCTLEAGWHSQPRWPSFREFMTAYVEDPWSAL